MNAEEKNNKTSPDSILVVGHRGLLGTELMNRLSDTGPVTGVDIDRCDIRRPDQIEAILDSVSPSWVINTAAYTDVDGCESNRKLAWAVNASGPANLARSCREHDIGLVHLSTDFVFNGRGQTPYRENDRPEPLSVYGMSKLGGEREVRKAGGRYLIIRTAWVFGPGGKNFPDTILAAARKRDSLSVVSDQVGTPTYAADLADCLKRLIRARSTGIVHVTNRGSCSWFEYARFVLKTAESATRVIPASSADLDRPAARPAYSVLDLSRYRELTGHTPRSWQEAVREYLAERS